jgi:hypothetical protein
MVQSSEARKKKQADITYKYTKYIYVEKRSVSI